MIPLDDPIWSRLHCHCITGQEFAEILASYYAGSIPPDDELWEYLLECICGGSVYDSAIAAAPHLVHLASRCAPSSAIIMLCVAARAVAEAKDEANSMDRLLTLPLHEASAAGIIEAMKTLETPDLDTLARREAEAALMAFSGDIAGYRQALADIDSWHDALHDHSAETTGKTTLHLRVEVIGGLDSPSSFTYSGEE